MFQRSSNTSLLDMGDGFMSISFNDNSLVSALFSTYIYILLIKK